MNDFVFVSPIQTCLIPKENHIFLIFKPPYYAWLRLWRQNIFFGENLFFVEFFFANLIFGKIFFGEHLFFGKNFLLGESFLQINFSLAKILFGYEKPVKLMH